MATLLHRARTGSGSLWQGGMDDVIQSGDEYDVIVLCAEEFQPKRSVFLRPQDKASVIYAPNDDSGTPISKAQADIACRAARQVAHEYRSGKKILVSCMQGRNRSGLVSALTLHLLYGMSGKDAMGFVKDRIPNSLVNPSFNRFLEAVKPLQTSAHAVRMTGYRNGRDGRDD
jgi:hypothetical protein